MKQKRNKAPRSKWKSLDMSSPLEKVRLRRQLIKKFTFSPILLETHGGTGQIYNRCYTHIETGVVFETDPHKAEILVKQRPNWAVYETDCRWALEQGIGGNIPFNFIDCDPYGHAWNTLFAFFQSERARAAHLTIVIHDGWRNSLKRFRSQTKMNIHLRDLLQTHINRFGGENIADNYIQVAQELLIEIAGLARYKVVQFGGFYSKENKNSTHFFANLKKENPQKGAIQFEKC